MKDKLITKLFLVVPIVTLLLVSCNSDGPEIEQPEKIYYDQAQRRIAAKNYFGAIESLEAIETRYPFGKYAEQAQVDAHIAAIRRANYVIENIPNSSENYRALKILEESYDSLGYVELLEDTRKIITLNYKDIQSQDSTDNSGWSWNFLQKSKPVSSD